MEKTDARKLACSLVVKQLREERERQKISMTVLAQKAGLAQATISFVERELRNPTLDTLYRIAGVLDVDLGKIVSEAARMAKLPGGRR